MTGTVGLEADGRFEPTARAQARRAMEIIVAAIEVLGGKPTDVVRTRIYVTDIDQWKEVGEVHHEFFESIRPATTMVQVARLIDPLARIFHTAAKRPGRASHKRNPLCCPRAAALIGRGARDSSPFPPLSEGRATPAFTALSRLPPSRGWMRS